MVVSCRVQCIVYSMAAVFAYTILYELTFEHYGKPPEYGCVHDIQHDDPLPDYLLSNVCVYIYHTHSTLASSHLHCTLYSLDHIHYTLLVNIPCITHMSLPTSSLTVSKAGGHPSLKDGVDQRLSGESSGKVHNFRNYF